MRDERKAGAIGFLEAAVVYYASLGVTVERVMTDDTRAISREPVALQIPKPRPKPNG
jgi:hypothetical protein